MMNGVICWHHFPPPGDKDTHRTAFQPPHKIIQQIQRGHIGPVQIIQKEDTGRSAAAESQEHLADPLKETALGTGTVQRRHWWQVLVQSGQLRKQASGFTQPMQRGVAKDASCGSTLSRQPSIPRQRARRPGSSHPRSYVLPRSAPPPSGRRPANPSARRVLPTPASPSRTMNWPSTEMALYASSRCPISSDRPTSG